jgi:hypothetical protein
MPAPDRFETHLYLSRAEHEAIRAYADREHRSVTAQIRWIVARWMESQTETERAAR